MHTTSVSAVSGASRRQSLGLIWVERLYHGLDRSPWNVFGDFGMKVEDEDGTQPRAGVAIGEAGTHRSNMDETDRAGPTLPFSAKIIRTAMVSPLIGRRFLTRRAAGRCVGSDEGARRWRTDR